MRNHAGLGQVLEMPLWSGLILPAPEDPAIRLLEGRHLCLDEVGNVAVLSCVEAGDGANGLAGAVANVGRSLAVFVEGAVVPGSDVPAIQPVLRSADASRL